MESKKLKNPILNELDDDALDHVSGGTEDDGWYWGYGFPPHYLNACPKCGGGVYSWPLPESMGGGIVFACGPCGWEGRSVSELAPGYIYNGWARPANPVLLHYDKGMTLKAVADKMGMSYINAKVTHKKALSGLRLAMGA